MPHKLYLLLTIVLLWQGCSQKVDKNEYRSYLINSANGLRKTLHKGSIEVVCIYRPTELFVAEELDSTLVPTKQVIDSLNHSFEGRTYLSLSLTKNGVELENQYLPDKILFTRAVTYLNTGIARDVYLIPSHSQSDSTTAMASIYASQYGSTGRSTVLLVFDTHHLDMRQGFTLSFHDTQFGLGTLRFPFSAEALANLPKLKFQ